MIWVPNTWWFISQFQWLYLKIRATLWSRIQVSHDFYVKMKWLFYKGIRFCIAIKLAYLKKTHGAVVKYVIWISEFSHIFVWKRILFRKTDKATKKAQLTLQFFSKYSTVLPREVQVLFFSLVCKSNAGMHV